MRGLDKVRAEFSLTALVYNLRRKPHSQTIERVVSPALASDNFEIFGPGTQTCGQYLASSEHDQLLAEYWISGFFSGVSLAEPTQNQNGMHDATGGKGLTSVLKIIKSICQGEPQETLQEISGRVWVLVTRKNPQ